MKANTVAFNETGQEIFSLERLQSRPHGIWTIGRKFCYRLLLCFLLPAILIGCGSGVSNTSRSQSEVATPSPTPDQAKEGSGVEYPVYRFTMEAGGAEFRLVYDWRERKCFAQLARKDDPTDLNKETVETIFTEDDCQYPYIYSIHHYIGSWDHPQLVVLGRGLGETCPALFRIVEFPHDDPGFVVTEDFGNCSPYTTLSFDGKKLTIKIKTLYFHPADVYADPETWVYSNKKLRQIKTAKQRR